MITMRVSGENLARCEARNVYNRLQPALEAAGLEWFTGLAPLHDLLHASQSPPKRVFYWARFHLTARKRQQVRYPCSDACLGCKQANQMNLALTAPIVNQPVKLLRQT